MVNNKSFRKRRYKATRSTRKRAMVAKSTSYELENKFRDFSHLDDAFTTTWTTMEPAASVECISAVAQGDTESTRDGRVYHINSIHVQGRFHRAAAESVTNPGDDLMCRVVIVLDKQTNGTQLTPTQVMLATTDNWDSFRNLQFTKRFQVLYDRKVVLKAFTTNEGGINLFATDDSSKQWRFNHTFKTPLRVTCSSTEAAVASFTDNSIHVIGCASATTALLSYNSRIRYTG